MNIQQALKTASASVRLERVDTGKTVYKWKRHNPVYRYTVHVSAVYPVIGNIEASFPIGSNARAFAAARRARIRIALCLLSNVQVWQTDVMDRPIDGDTGHGDWRQVVKKAYRAVK